MLLPSCSVLQMYTTRLFFTQALVAIVIVLIMLVHVEVLGKRGLFLRNKFLKCLQHPITTHLLRITCPTLNHNHLHLMVQTPRNRTTTHLPQYIMIILQYVRYRCQGQMQLQEAHPIKDLVFVLKVEQMNQVRLIFLFKNSNSEM